MDVRIYQPGRTPTQSGRANSQDWVLEPRRPGHKFLDPLMGWTGSCDTDQQVYLRFANREDAVVYASHHHHNYVVEEPRKLRPKIKRYSDNFKYNRVR